ncbi:hypothetical protein ACQR1Y_09175 [Bradyrhizobium sp. HKCCYLRH3099]|uniref:hypothetical protein n=1 Tax=unclassified Bradyrhizobium TaxID=2631580 RepID=UPI003EBCE3F0
MTFILNEREDQGAVEWFGEWPFPARAHFITSNAYDTLMRELTRYVKGEVPGRSFLVAGHRGAGKTSLVRQVVDDLNRSIIDKAVKTASAKGSDRGRMLNQQRPLLVKLHGPSLLPAATRPAPAADKSTAPNNSETKPGAKSKTKTKPEVTIEITTGGAQMAEGGGEPAAPEQPAPAAPDLTVTALEQITVALYRALAAEFGRSFTNHARDEIYQAEQAGTPRAQVADYLELAGQFTLELDNVPRPGTLRAFYRRLGRVDAGVLWPYDVGAALAKAGLNDRGIREIVALATAAQAFEVCSGTVKSTQTDKESQSRERSFDVKNEAVFKDAINKVAGLAVGAGVGALSVDTLGAPAAIVLGLGAWLLGTLTLNWTSKRTAKSERSIDYTFVRNRDKQSLERDLPVVIERVREAGLAPVFMLDELDKLDDAATSISTLIKNLKHLTTDFGCFCFLTDRKYYDALMDKVEREAFPVEHTYFSHFLFILPHPDRFVEFLRAITIWVPASQQDLPDEAARAIFGLFVLHRSKLNMAEVLRELAEQCDVDGRLRRTPADLKRLEYTFAASIQLAIGLILKRDGIRQRIEAEPRFMQLAIDALYLLSRAWEKKQAKVKLDRAAIVDCLLERSGAPAAREGETAEQRLLRSGVGPLDLDLIDRSVAAFAELVCDCVELKDELSKDGRSDMAAIIPQPNLIERIGDTREYKFIYDMYGEEVVVRDKLRSALAAAGLPTAIKKQIDDPLEFLSALTAALGTHGMDIQDLITLQILPATVDVAELDRAKRRLDDASKFDRPYDGMAKDLPLIGAVIGFARQNGIKLAALFRLACQVSADARPSGSPELMPLRVALKAVARYVDLQAFFQQSDTFVIMLDAITGRPADPQGPALTDDVQSVKDWSANLKTLSQGLTNSTPAIEAYRRPQLWSVWRDRVFKHLISASSLVEPPSYADIVCAAAEESPGNLFQRNLANMSLAQWSRICVLGFSSPDDGYAPRWLFLAALAALGFGRRLLAEAASLLDGPEQEDWALIIMQSPERKEGHLLVFQNESTSIASEPPKLDPSPDSRPLLALPEGELEAYDDVLGWLIRRKALEATIFEEASLDV